MTTPVGRLGSQRAPRLSSYVGQQLPPPLIATELQVLVKMFLSTLPKANTTTSSPYYSDSGVATGAGHN